MQSSSTKNAGSGRGRRPPRAPGPMLSSSLRRSWPCLQDDVQVILRRSPVPNDVGVQHADHVRVALARDLRVHRQFDFSGRGGQPQSSATLCRPESLLPNPSGNLCFGLRIVAKFKWTRCNMSLVIISQSQLWLVMTRGYYCFQSSWSLVK